MLATGRGAVGVGVGVGFGGSASGLDGRALGVPPWRATGDGPLGRADRRDVVDADIRRSLAELWARHDRVVDELALSTAAARIRSRAGQPEGRDRLGWLGRLEPRSAR